MVLAAFLANSAFFGYIDWRLTPDSEIASRWSLSITHL
jgi:hypothetical protein